VGRLTTGPVKKGRGWFKLKNEEAVTGERGGKRGRAPTSRKQHSKPERKCGRGEGDRAQHLAEPGGCCTGLEKNKGCSQPCQPFWIRWDGRSGKVWAIKRIVPESNRGIHQEGKTNTPLRGCRRWSSPKDPCIGTTWLAERKPESTNKSKCKRGFLETTQRG